MSYEEDFMDFVRSTSTDDYVAGTDFTMSQFCHAFLFDRDFLRSNDKCEYAILLLEAKGLNKIAIQLIDAWLDYLRFLGVKDDVELLEAM